MFAILRRMVWMTMPGLAALVVTAGLVGGVIGELVPADAARFVVFLQVELLAIGVARLGLEQLVLSRASSLADPASLSFTQPLLRVVLPLGLVLSAGLGVTLGGWPGIALVLVAPLDILSSVVAAFELACRRYVIPIILTWMNYPVFLLLLVMPGIPLDRSQLAHVLLLFCLTSVARSALSAVLLIRHERRRRHRERETLRAREAFGVGIVNCTLTMMQRLDGLVLAAFSSRFAASLVVPYLLSTRLLDASYSLSAVLGSVQQVARRPARSGQRLVSLRSLVPAACWLALWLLGAAVLAFTQRPDILGAAPELLVAALGAAVYLLSVRLMLAQLATGRTRQLAWRYGAYLAVFLALSVAAVISGRPMLMLGASVGTGIASGVALLHARRTVHQLGGEAAGRHRYFFPETLVGSDWQRNDTSPGAPFWTHTWVERPARAVRPPAPELPVPVVGRTCPELGFQVLARRDATASTGRRGST